MGLLNFSSSEESPRQRVDDTEALLGKDAVPQEQQPITLPWTNWSRRSFVASKLAWIVGLIICGTFLSHATTRWRIKPSPYADLSLVRFPTEYSRMSPSSQSASQWQVDVTTLTRFSPSPPPHTLTRLAWVVFVSPDHVNHYAETLQTLSCYAARHGISLYIDYKLHDSRQSTLKARHWNVAKYLRYHQWIIATDADIFLANSAKDIHSFIDKADRDGIDFILSDRNWEVCACLYFVKNSAGGWHMLRQWLAWRPSRSYTPNWDNGDLMEMFAAATTEGSPILHPSGLGRNTEEAIAAADIDNRDCINTGDYGRFPGCIVPTYFDAGRSTIPTKPYWDTELFSWTNETVHIRVYREYGGLVRDHPQSERGAPAGYLSGDFLYHALKTGETPGPEAVLCMGIEWKYEPAASLDDFAAYLVEQDRTTWWAGCWSKEGEDLCRKQVEQSQTARRLMS